MGNEIKQASIGPDKHQAASAQTTVPAVRLRPIQRDQLCWQMLDVERLIDEADPKRNLGVRWSTGFDVVPRGYRIV